MALDFVAGCIGGCAGVVVGHPLDTVKTHLQSGRSNYTGTLSCLRALLAKEGLRGVYRGMSSPLGSVALINAIVFGVYGNSQRYLDMSALSSHFYAGAIAGFAQSFICSPMELAKSRTQISSSQMGPLHCLKTIYRTQGIKSVFKGLNLTILREVPAFGTYFFTYELLTRRDDGKAVSTANMLWAGGWAGITSWVVVYPVDVVKTRMQLDGSEGPAIYKNATDCVRKSVRSGGVQNLYKGLAPTVVRAFPVNAATFVVVTWSMRLLGGGEGLWEAVCSLKVPETAPV